MKDGVVIRIIFDSSEVTIKNVEGWFREKYFFEPTHIRSKYLTQGNLRKFNHNRFFENINKILEDDRFDITVENEKNDFSLTRGTYTNKIAWLSCRLTPEKYESNKGKVIEYINTFMKKHKGIAAIMCSLRDYFWQNNENIQYHCAMGKSMEGVHTKPNPIFPTDTIVDTEFNPGHNHIVNGICFGSCWTMWFGQEFFSYIPKSILKNYQGCYENKEISEGLIRIMLYENIWAYDEPDNRDRQLQFRKQVGIDEVAHSYLKQRDRRVIDNPAIEINSGSFEHGGVRLLTYYYDAEEILVAKSKAVVAKKYELDEKGKTVWEDVRNLK